MGMAVGRSAYRSALVSARTHSIRQRTKSALCQRASWRRRRPISLSRQRSSSLRSARARRLGSACQRRRHLAAHHRRHAEPTRPGKARNHPRTPLCESSESAESSVAKTLAESKSEVFPRSFIGVASRTRTVRRRQSRSHAGLRQPTASSSPAPALPPRRTAP